MLTAMKLSKIAQIVGSPYSGRDVDIVDIAYDSRDVRPGSLFVCIKGRNDDGHRFAPDAAARGASALICERDVPGSIPRIRVPDARDAMNVLAAPFFENPSRHFPVVGITGTNGKTTTAFMIESAVKASGGPAGLIGTVEVHVAGDVFAGIRTTPESVDLQRLFRRMLDAGVRACAMEATSEGIEAGRIEGTRFDTTIFTNLTQDHLDAHGTMESYFAAKQRIFEPHHTSRTLINVDDPWGQRLAEETSCEVTTYGFRPECDLRATDIELSPAGSKFRAVGLVDAELETPIPGKFNVYNALAAAGACSLLGIDSNSIVEGIGSLRGVPGRFEPVEAGQPFSVIVDYAHTPDSLANVLETARGFAEGRVVCVFGCGGDRDLGKRPFMGEVAAKLADLVVVTSDNPRSEDPEAIIRAIVSGVELHPPRLGYEVESDRSRAIRIALERGTAGDVVVIAGKGHESGQEFADRKIPFDDRVVAAEILIELYAEKPR